MKSSSICEINHLINEIKSLARETHLWPLFRDNIKKIILDVALYHDFIVPSHWRTARELLSEKLRRYLKINVCKKINFINTGLVWFEEEQTKSAEAGDDGDWLFLASRSSGEANFFGNLLLLFCLEDSFATPFLPLFLVLATIIIFVFTLIKSKMTICSFWLTKLTNLGVWEPVQTHWACSSRATACICRSQGSTRSTGTSNTLINITVTCRSSRKASKWKLTNLEREAAVSAVEHFQGVLHPGQGPRLRQHRIDCRCTHFFGRIGRKLRGSCGAVKKYTACGRQQLSTHCSQHNKLYPVVMHANFIALN